MSNLLVLKSSILGNHSQTNQLSNYLTAQLSDAHIIERDLSTYPLPIYDSVAANALRRGETNSEKERELVALSDQLIEELKSVDTLVINAPMYNFNIPTQLKTYFDFIARAGVTFRYGEKGAEGLITGKKAIILCAFGGIHKGTATDLVTPYIKTFLAFIGITDVQFVYAEAIGYGPEAIEKAQNQAKQQIDQIVKTR